MNKENFRILVLDDERSFLLFLTRILTDEGYTVKGITDPQDALNELDSFSPNLIITDLKMPKMDGMTLMRLIMSKNRDVDFIVITAFATIETAVTAMKSGALDYITKPLSNPDQLRIAVAKVFERQILVNENVLLKSGVLRDIPPMDILFAGMDNILREIEDVASTDATVILYGETGTGKSVVAKVIHHLSGRNGPFVDINCAAIPENLLESELFGHEKGAFTGALSQKKGKFEFANSGTLFLDEVCEMSPALQGKLLRVLQDKTFERLGSLNTIRSDARVIAASNKNLRELVGNKTFREDLFYRLNVFPIIIPSLRDRKKHLPDIAKYLASIMAARLGKVSKTIAESGFKKLINYSWPGNIRELENVIERSIIVSRSEEVVIPDLEALHAESHGDLQLDGDLRTVEKNAIENALAKTNGNRRKAAELLGISLRSLQYKIKEYGLTSSPA